MPLCPHWCLYILLSGRWPGCWYGEALPVVWVIFLFLAWVFLYLAVSWVTSAGQFVHAPFLLFCHLFWVIHLSLCTLVCLVLCLPIRMSLDLISRYKVLMFSFSFSMTKFWTWNFEWTRDYYPDSFQVPVRLKTFKDILDGAIQKIFASNWDEYRQPRILGTGKFNYLL